MEAVDLGMQAAYGAPLAGGMHWSVQPGEFWVVGGMHRSGKSTLLTTIAMLQKPLAGKIEIFGKDPWEFGELGLREQRLRMGMLFEAGARLFHRMTVAENIALPICYHNDCRKEEAAERVAEILEFAVIEEMAGHMPGDLTRAYRQRASLARALALAPELLLLDNPLVGIDLRESEWWLKTISSLSAGHPITGNKPMTVVLVTDHLRPWIRGGRNFALLDGRNWRHIGGVSELQQSDEPLLKELLRSDFY